MYKTVVSLTEISKCQRALEKKLNQVLTLSGEFYLGFRGGVLQKTINFNKNIWFYSYEIGKDEKSPRYWNGFGLAENLNKTKSNNIVVEINIPTTGINRSVSGFYAKDENGNICLFHRGGLGGGRKGIGKAAFLNWSSYELKNVMTEDRIELAILVGNVSSKNFVNDLYDFLSEISQFKSLATSGEIDEVTCLSDDDLRNKINAEMPRLKSPKKTENTAVSYERSMYVKEYALRKAKGKCQLCLKLAPFKNAVGKPYLEVHHIEWLSNGGEDTPENVAALCPNCHRKMHIVNDANDKRALFSKASY